MTTYDLWKVFEIIRENIGGPVEGTAMQKIRADGWIKPDDLDSFVAVIHDSGVSGDAARHARKRSKPAVVRDIDWARRLVAKLVREWRRTL